GRQRSSLPASTAWRSDEPTGGLIGWMVASPRMSGEATSKVAAAAALLRGLGHSRVAVLATDGGREQARAIVEETPSLMRLIVTKSGTTVPSLGRDLEVLSILAAARSGQIDGLLVVENDKLADLMRGAEPLFQNGIVVTPADPGAVVPEW